MRGIGHTLSRHPAARVLLAGAAILAGAGFASAAQAQSAGSGNGDETATAVPRFAPPGGGVALPRPLALSEAVRIRRIFALQTRGNLIEATRETEALGDPLLLGHILADRYLGRFHRSTAEELRDWLTRFDALPDAPAVHALLLLRLPKGVPPPPPPAGETLAQAATLPSAPPEEIDQAMRSIARIPTLDETVAARGREGDETAALRLIIANKGLEPAYAALLRAELAQSLFAQNRDAEALDIAGTAFRRGLAAGKVGYAGYIAGLAAWRLGRADIARFYFEDAARAPLAAPALRAAAAFWAARANTRSGHAAGYVPWLRRAAQENRTFYGMLARRTLGQAFGLAWQRESLGEADIAAVDATPRGRRAFALLQVGEVQRAEAELRRLWMETKENPVFSRALLLVAREADMIDFAAQLAALVQSADGRAHDDVRFALPKLAPRGGFRVDPALVYAVARQESNFDTTAVSPAGARGLMQLMPVTADFIARGPVIAPGDTQGGHERLHDPAVNLELGQRYMLYLSQQDIIGDDLIRLLASYNSGAGSFARWGANLRHDNDPLLFIEAIPNSETRNFVQRVLAYSWIYAARLRLPTTSLSELADGRFPRFVARGTTPYAMAAPRLH